MKDEGGVSWAPFAAAAAAVPLLGAGAAPWLAAPAAAAMSAVATAVVARWAARKRVRSHPASELDGLRRALRRRDEQLATTVHELRTPLASVVTALELLRDEPAGSPDDSAEIATIAAAAARHLAFLVDDVLDREALRTGTLRLAIGSHRIDGLVDEGLRTLRLLARSRDVQLRAAAIDGDVAVRTDPRRFVQILFNLVGNALKFSPPGGTIEVGVETGPHRVRVAIVDHGPGVPDELRDRLFSPLGADDGGGLVPGTGLGLFVCARIVQQLGGRIGHDRPPDGGSAFWFDQPRALPRPANTAIADSAGTAR
ncbi:MAG: HAMP domain-containing histidine kinase [Planctomycetes bacterium]|nr:HAMP domain-containing histidine kinase [Planctomycetota bacterium]